jgi:hypothetical protein
MKQNVYIYSCFWKEVKTLVKFPQLDEAYCLQFLALNPTGQITASRTWTHNQLSFALSFAACWMQA